MRKQLLPLFQRLDAEHSGYVSSAELQAVVRLLKLDLSEAQVHAILTQADPSGSDQVSFEAFVEGILWLTSEVGSRAGSSEDRGARRRVSPSASDRQSQGRAENASRRQRQHSGSTRQEDRHGWVSHEPFEPAWGDGRAPKEVHPPSWRESYHEAQLGRDPKSQLEVRVPHGPARMPRDEEKYVA